MTLRHLTSYSSCVNLTLDGGFWNIVLISDVLSAFWVAFSLSHSWRAGRAARWRRAPVNHCKEQERIEVIEREFGFKLTDEDRSGLKVVTWHWVNYQSFTILNFTSSLQEVSESEIQHSARIGNFRQKQIVKVKDVQSCRNFFSEYRCLAESLT